MAQTVEEIYNALVAEKASFESLDSLSVPSTSGGRTQAQQLMADLNNRSRVAIWRLILWVVSFLGRALQVLWDRTRTELNDLAASAQPGTARWLVQQSLNFRDGYVPDIDSNFRIAYSTTATDDQTAAIVTAAAVKDEYGVAVLKVAKGSPGSYTILSVDEMTRFRSYVNLIRFAGQTIYAVSRSADQLKLNVSVYFDGLESEASVLTAVQDAINGYLNGLDFAGDVYTSKVVDAIQSVTGVRDVVVNSIQAKKALGTYGSFGRIYETHSGYIVLDDTSTFTMVSQ